MNNPHPNDFFIPGLELIPLTDEYDDVDSGSNDRDEPMVDWIDDCQVQENLFQIIPLMPEETRCDKDNHIIQSDAKVFFEELGFLCDEPEPIDPGRNYEAEYKQQQQKYNDCNRRRRQRQRHVDLETMPTPTIPRHGTLDIASPGLSSTSSSFYHTDDDEDHTKSSTFHHPGRLPHLNHHHHFHHHHHPSPSTLSKSTLTHFSFTSARS